MASLTPEDDPLISVIIPVWNGPAYLRLCLGALDRQSLARENFEVIVSDNGSTDETTDVAANWPGVRLVSEPSPGSYAARNTALAAARGRYIAFTDADCIPHEDWLATAKAAIQATPGAGVYGGRIDLFSADGGGWEACRAYEALFAFRQAENIAAGQCITANWVSPADLLRAAGGFNGALKSGGDVDLSRRLSGAGHPAVYIPDMIVAHPSRGSLAELINKRRRVLGGLWASAEKPSAVRRLRHVANDVIGKSKRVVKASHLDWPLRISILAVIMILGLSGMLEIFRLRLGGAPRRA